MQRYLSRYLVVFVKANYRVCPSGCASELHDWFTEDECVLLNTSTVAADTHTASPSTVIYSAFLV